VPDAPTPASGGLDDLYDIARLADRLGVEHATVRVWLSRKVPWLPPPDGRLNGGAVWRAATLVGLEERRHPGRPGPKPRLSAVMPVAGGIPVVSVAAGIPLPGRIPVAAAACGTPGAPTGAVPVIPVPAEPPDAAPAASAARVTGLADPLDGD
jgi:hypothetical protein